MPRALRAEIAKLKGTRVPLWTALVVVLWPLMVIFMVRLGDQSLEHVTWESFMPLASQSIASWYGILLFGYVAAYVFGREFSERTARGLLTLPVRREYFMVSKLVVVLVWVFGLGILSVVAQAGYAAILGFDGFAWKYLLSGLADAMTVTLIIAATLPVIGLLAILGHGYLVPMVFSGVAFTSSFMFLQIGWEQWYPWSMPIMIAGSGWIPREVDTEMVAASWVILLALFVGATAAILIYIDRADNLE